MQAETPDAAGQVQGQALLEVRQLVKRFAGVQALTGVDLTVAPGQAHALVGENGAGKSTLMRILIGLETPDAGEIRYAGRTVSFRHPHAALRAGLSMIHQELMPFPDLTVAENLLMGQEPASRGVGWINRRALDQQAAAWLERLHVPVSPRTPMRSLRVAEIQAVEIARALAHRARLLILDEPTSALSHRETEALFHILRDLRASGVALLYVSHKLDEIFRLADVITVLRDGRHVATVPAHTVNDTQLISLMVGRDVERQPPPLPPRQRQVVLSVRSLGRRHTFAEVSFDVRRGEVVGLAGLMGAGRTEVLQALYGLPPADAGEIRVHGRPVRIRTPQDALAAGLALVTEDRQRSGLILPLPLKHNLTLGDLATCCHGPWLSPTAENRVADDRIRRFGIRAAHRDQPVRHLSGGNQQKVVLARALAPNPDIVLLDEPTRGIDVAAKAEIHELIRQLAASGKAVVVVSSELPEVLALSHRVLVLHQGRLVAELDPRQTTAETVLGACLGRGLSRGS